MVLLFILDELRYVFARPGGDWTWALPFSARGKESLPPELEPFTGAGLF